MARLAQAKVHRNIEMQQQWGGLEIPDGILLGTLAGLLIYFNSRGFFWNVVAVAIAYVSLRIAKRGRPEGWLTAFARHFGRRSFYSAAAPDLEGRAHPFSITAAQVKEPGPRCLSTPVKKR